MAQAWAAAAVAVGEDVAALVAFWFGHDGYSPLVDVRSQSLRTKWFRSGLLVCGLNAKSPRLSPEGSFCVWFYFSGWRGIIRRGDVIGWLGVRGGLGLTGFWALADIRGAPGEMRGSSLRSE